MFRCHMARDATAPKTGARKQDTADGREGTGGDENKNEEPLDQLDDAALQKACVGVTGVGEHVGGGHAGLVVWVVGGGGVWTWAGG